MTSTHRSADERARELIGKAIRVRREKAGLSRPDAAGLLGISDRTLQRWEEGHGTLWTGGDAGCTDLAMMRKLKEAYGSKMSELLPRNQYPSAPLDPALRREWVWRRNALIQRVDVDEYRKMIAEREKALGEGRVR